MYRKILGPIIALLVVLMANIAFGAAILDHLSTASVTATGNDTNTSWTRDSEKELFNFTITANTTANITEVNITVPVLSGTATNYTVDNSTLYIIGNETKWSCVAGVADTANITKVRCYNDTASASGFGNGGSLYIAFYATAADLNAESWQSWNISTYDGVGGAANSTTVLTGIDGVNPTATITTDRGYVYQRQTITPSCTVSDTAMGTLNSTYYRFSVVAPDGTRTALTGLSSEFSETSQRGTYTIHCDAEDSVGNYYNATKTFEARSRVTSQYVGGGEEATTTTTTQPTGGEEATTTTTTAPTEETTTTTQPPAPGIVEVILSPFVWLWNLLFGWMG